MLNQEKVKYMTKAAAYENGPEKKNIEISSYYRTDYLGLQMVKSVFAYAAAFAILVLLWAIGRIEELMLLVSRAEYLEKLLKLLGILFAAGLVAYELIVYAYFSKRFYQAKLSVKGFYRQLKKIDKLYEMQRSSGTEEESSEASEDEENLL